MPKSCEACEGRGFLWGYTLVGNLRVVERCDVCKRFDSDEAACRRIVATAEDVFFTWGKVRDPILSRVVSVVVLKGGDAM